MKKLIGKLQKKTVQAFTLIEMLVVLLIISVLMLLFVPNLSKQKEVVQEKGSAAVVKVVESQANIYELNNDGATATLSKLVSEGSITAKQQKAYNDYYAKNAKETRHVAN